MPESAKLIECRGLRLGYGSHEVALSPDFSVGEGDFVAVVGPNGCGKTTLLKTVAGLVKPLGGIIGTAEQVACGGIGYLPQLKSVQRDFPASVMEVVESGCRAVSGFWPWSSLAERRLARGALVKFGLASLRGKSFRDLSGGQRQRVLLARALAAPRKILLLDEPSTGLDPEAAAEMYSLLKEVNRSGLAVLMVTHDLSPALRMATHVLRLGPSASFERNPRHD